MRYLTEIISVQNKYTEVYRLEENVIPASEIIYSTTTDTQVQETLCIRLYSYFYGYLQTLDGNYLITRLGKDERTIVRYFNRCSATTGCKIDTKTVSYLPHDITDFLRNFPEHIQDLAGVL